MEDRQTLQAHAILATTSPEHTHTFHHNTEILAPPPLSTSTAIQMWRGCHQKTKRLREMRRHTSWVSVTLRTGMHAVKACSTGGRHALHTFKRCSEHVLVTHVSPQGDKTTTQQTDDARCPRTSLGRSDSKLLYHPQRCCERSLSDVAKFGGSKVRIQFHTQLPFRAAIETLERI